MSSAYLALTVKLPGPPTQPTSYRPDLVAQILEAIAEGESVPSICTRLCLSRQTVLRWRMEHPEFAEAYRIAVELRAEALVDEMGETCRKALANEVDTRALSPVLRNMEWRAMVMNRTLYGQKQEVQHSGGLTLGINTRWQPKPVIDVEAA